jgi:phosphopantetheinyl transferase (holo-ACP synthase)
MGVVNLPSGKPTHGDRRWRRSAARRDDARRASRGIHLTITDDWPMAQAFVVIIEAADWVRT